MESYFGGLELTRLLLARGLAGLYLLAFVSARNQFPALLGEDGLLPVPRFTSRVTFREAPSLFHFRYSDRIFAAVAYTGIVLSACVLFGVADLGPWWCWLGVWLVIWAAYLSIVNVGQTFYGFGWESMLLEAGFFAAFLGPASVEASALPVLALRWMLFRTELGAGLIKLRGDSCWRDCTCLYFHHETQPLPNALSWYFHRLPKLALRAGVVFSHFVQVVVPFGLFLPQPFAAGAGALIIFHQLLLIVSGNYAWLNWLTVVLGLGAFGDAQLALVWPLDPSTPSARSFPHDLVLYALACVTIALSVKPALNLFSKNQLMNYSYNSLHLVNAYGAFGSVTRERIEVVVEGCADDTGDDWKEYGFKAKPGELMRRPPQVAPYHLRLDWLMWFLPFGNFRRHELWFLRFVDKLLLGDRRTLALLRHVPFPNEPPRRIRALAYHYQFTDRQERARHGAYWKRRLVAEILPPVSRSEMLTARKVA